MTVITTSTLTHSILKWAFSESNWSYTLYILVVSSQHLFSLWVWEKIHHNIEHNNRNNIANIYSFLLLLLKSSFPWSFIIFTKLEKEKQTLSKQGTFYRGGKIPITEGIFLSRRKLLHPWTDLLYPGRDLSFKRGVFLSQMGLLFPGRDLSIEEGTYFL